MAQAEVFPGCDGLCPYFEPVQGSCSHDQRQMLISFLQEHNNAPCPVFEGIRSHEMQKLAAKFEHTR